MISAGAAYFDVSGNIIVQKTRDMRNYNEWREIMGEPLIFEIISMRDRNLTFLSDESYKIQQVNAPEKDF
jgi:hypothetical protein